MAGQLGDPANAMVWGKDFACTDLAMSRADEDAQAQAETLVREVGGVTPLAGLAMAMAPNRTLRVAAHFEDSDRARKNLRPRAELAVGEAIGRGGSFSDDFELTSSKAVGSDVVLDLRPRTKTGYVLSARVRRAGAVRDLLSGMHVGKPGAGGTTPGSAADPGPAALVGGDQHLLEVAHRLVVGGAGLGPGAVGVELPAGGVRVEGEVEQAR